MALKDFDLRICKALLFAGYKLIKIFQNFQLIVQDHFQDSESEGSMS